MNSQVGPERSEPLSSRDAILAALRDVLPQLEQSGVTELDVVSGETRLFLRRRPGHAITVTSVGRDEWPAVEDVLDETLVAVTAPLSGVFFAAPAPDEPPYVNEGDDVEAGQVVALVEAMKVFNEIHVDVPGTIVKIHVASGQLVQSGQALLYLRPSASSPAPEGEPV